MDVCL